MAQIDKRVARRLSHLALFGISLFGCLVAFASEVWPQKHVDPDVLMVQNLLQQPTGYSSGISEKQSNRLGDRVSIALRKIFKKDELQDPDNVRKFLPIIRSAFSYPDLVPMSFRNPRVTIGLLSRLQRTIGDNQLKTEIDDLQRFVVEQTKPKNKAH